MLHRLVSAFPLWVLMASVLAFGYPPLFTWFSGPLIPIGLGVIMLGMGLTLTLEDFKRVLEYPLWVFTGVFFQYLLMPLFGWSLGYLYGLPVPFAVGLVLVSCCPGGTASNVIAFLAQVNVALSVTMTAVSTLLAVVMTPLLTTWLVGSRVEVDAWGLFLSTVQIVILPVSLGLFLHQRFPRLTQRILPAAPSVAVLTITLIVGSIIGAGKAEIMKGGPPLLLAVFSLHFFGFLVGYLMSRVLLRVEKTARTISIEVGMQNSGLGVVLAMQNFANPLVAIPSAISSLFHCILGSILAAYWRNRTGHSSESA